MLLVINLLAWLAVGAMTGWLVSRLLRSRGRAALLVDVGVGMVGALLAGMWIAPLIALPEDALRLVPSVNAVAITSLGAVAVLLVVHAIPVLLRRRRHQH